MKLFSCLKMNVRKSILSDLPRIMEIYREAREIMISCGNIHQWPLGYPYESKIKGDIDNGHSYVIEDEGDIVGVFTFIIGKDPTYGYIEGSWIEDTKPYGTIHSLGSLKRSHNVARTCFEWCWQQIDNLRVDTHEENVIMRHCVEKFGFQYCGTIYLENGSPRRAYQKIK